MLCSKYFLCCLSSLIYFSSITVFALAATEDESNEIVGFGASCDYKPNGPVCNNSLACLVQLCACQYGERHQWFDSELRLCRSNLNGPCDLNGPKQQCLDNAVCSIQPRTGLAECQCGPGFTEYVGGGSSSNPECIVDFGGDCTNQPNQRCDSNVLLFCRNRKCNCRSTMEIFDSVQKRCLGGVGYFCTSDSDCVSAANCYKDPKFSERTWTSRFGRCECDEYYSATSNRTCQFSRDYTNYK